LKTVFGLTTLRHGQQEVIDAVLSGKHTLALMPTGAGKSLCYQVPAIKS
jgi:ATP-dependent DNA helicase RecQ